MNTCPFTMAALDAAVHFEKVVAGFSRYHKYTLGTELRHASRHGGGAGDPRQRGAQPAAASGQRSTV